MQQFNKILIALGLLLTISNIISATTIACKCPVGMCCLKDGYCGHSNTYCGEGCQAGPCLPRIDPPNGTYTGRVT